MNNKFNNIKFIKVKKKLNKYNKFNNIKNFYKYTKFFKIKFKSSVKNIIFKSNQIQNYNCFFIISKKSFYFNDFHFKSIKNFIRKPYTKIFKFRILPFFSIFTKPNEVRMGKGKGNKFFCKIFPINLGQICTIIKFKYFSKIKKIKIFKKIFYYFFKLPNKFKINKVFLYDF